MPRWTPYTADAPHVMRFGDHTGMDTRGKSELLDFLMGLDL
jgi:hypothetical protein